MSRREKRRETAVFKAVCPLEIGDTVAIGVGKTAAGVRTAYYLSLIHI